MVGIPVAKQIVAAEDPALVEQIVVGVVADPSEWDSEAHSLAAVDMVVIAVASDPVGVRLVAAPGCSFLEYAAAYSELEAAFAGVEQYEAHVADKPPLIHRSIPTVSCSCFSFLVVRSCYR